MFRRSALFFLCCSILLFPAVVSAQNTDFSGAGDGTTWSDAANWVGGVVPAGNADIGDGFTVTLNSNQSHNEVDVVGDQSSGTATLNQTAGTVTGGGWIKLGRNTGNNGTFNQSGTSVYTGHTVFHIGQNGVGEANFSDSAEFTHTQRLELGASSAGTGTVNISGNATLTSSDGNTAPGGRTTIGNGGIGVLNVTDSGVWNNVSNRVTLGNQGDGTINISGNGTVNVDNLNTGNGGGTGTINVTGGALNSNQWLALGQGTNNGGTGILNHSAGTITQLSLIHI